MGPAGLSYFRRRARSRIRFGEDVAEAVEAAFPRGAAIADPLFEGGEAGGVEAAGANAAGLFGVDEAGFFEHFQVLGDGGKRDSERGGEAGDGLRAVAKAFDDGAPGGVAEGVEDAVDVNRR